MTLSILQLILQQHLALIVIGAVLLLLLPAIAITRSRANARTRREREALQAQIEDLRRENHSITELTSKLARRLKDTEAQLAQLGTRIESAKAQEQVGESSHAYAQAIRMVRKGADANRLVADFGLSRGEAELVAHLHGQRKAI